MYLTQFGAKLSCDFKTIDIVSLDKGRPIGGANEQEDQLEIS